MFLIREYYFVAIDDSICVENNKHNFERKKNTRNKSVRISQRKVYFPFSVQYAADDDSLTK